TMSPEPPAGYGTMIFTGRAGHVCASADAHMKMHPASTSFSKRMDAPRTEWTRLRSVHLVAFAPGHEQVGRQLGADAALACHLEHALAHRRELDAHPHIVVVIGDLRARRAAGNPADAKIADF